MKPIDILIPDEFRVYFEQNDGVVKYPDPLLRKVAKPVQRITPDLEHLIEHMLQVMKRAKGIGLAVWQYTRSSQPSDDIPTSAYPQPVQGQPTVEEVGPPPDVVPAGTPDSAPTPPPIKGR